MIVESHTVIEAIKRQRLSDYCVGIFQTIPSRKGIKKTILKKRILINGKIGFTADYVNSGDVIALLEEPSSEATSITIPLDILFEDDDLAVINKPAGIITSGSKKWTLANALQYNLQKSSKADSCTPKLVHRLDYPTSGVIIAGKTRCAIAQLNQLFASRSIQKTYIAITIGELAISGTISTASDNKESITEYERIDRVVSLKYGYLNLVKLYPKTGRKHQLRKHLSGSNSPILGDKKYGLDGLISYGNGLYLHAWRVILEHPINHSPLNICAPVPRKFLKLFPMLSEMTNDSSYL